MRKLAPMQVGDIPRCISIWRDQFNRYCKSDAFPDFLHGGRECVENYLLRQIEKSNAIVAIENGVVVGYMAWMYFDFHGERTAFLPIVGSAAVAEIENAVYHDLYLEAAQRWVRDDRFNHLWMTFYNDAELKEMLYDLGFGSYVIDACQRVSPHTVNSMSDLYIEKATEQHADAVLALAAASEANLFEPPVFLVREPWKREGIVELINDQQVFVAYEDNRMVGVLSVNLNQKHHLERLTNPDSAYIGGIGAYIVPEYRGKGVGTKLLEEAFACCHKAGKRFLHVSYETANPDASRFWPKHFKPAIRSVRRTINKDANTLSKQ